MPNWFKNYLRAAMRRTSFVKNRLEIVMYSYVHSVFSPIFASLFFSMTTRKQIFGGWIASLFFICVFSQAAMAQTGEWQVEEGGRIRVSYDANPRRGVEAGEVHGVIEVELEPGWKTYWKNPGSSGMAPELKFFYSNERGEKTELASELLFPTPSTFTDETGKGVIFGYKNLVALPFRLTLPAKTGKILGSLLIGLCDDVCMPVQVDFVFDIDKRADFLTKGRIEAAMAALP